MDDAPVGGVVADAPLTASITADGPLVAAVVVDQPIDVDLGAGQGIAGSQGRPGATGPVATIVCAEPTTPGLPIYVDRASRQLRAARADDYRAAFVAGLATSAIAVGFAANVLCGQVILADWTSAAGSTDLAPGLVYYLAPQGGLTTVPPVGLPGVSIVTVGRAADARTLFVAPSNPILQ